MGYIFYDARPKLRVRGYDGPQLTKFQIHTKDTFINVLYRHRKCRKGVCIYLHKYDKYGPLLHRRFVVKATSFFKERQTVNKFLNIREREKKDKIKK